MAGKRIIGGIIIIIVLIIAITFVVALTGGAAVISTRDGSEQKFKYECSVIVEEDLFGKGVSIESVSCVNTGKKCGGFFSFFSAEGVVEIWDSTGRLSSKQFKTGLFSGEDALTLQACSADDVFSIRLYDEERNLIDEQNA